MVCPHCLHKKTEIYNSRPAEKSATVWRRRKCSACHKVFTTQEYAKLDSIWKVQSGSKKAPYSRAKLALSILRACDHRKNELTVWYLFEAAEQKLFPIAASAGDFLTTQQIMEVVLALLKNFDAVAYVKYLSYHQPSMDAQSLRKHLKK